MTDASVIGNLAKSIQGGRASDFGGARCVGARLQRASEDAGTMDDYPEHLAPEFNEGGGVTTPFDEWWPRVRDEFPTVPEEVARYWLHEHWSQSPYSWLRSRDYSFERRDWPTTELSSILSRFGDFDPAQYKCLEEGRRYIDGQLPHFKDDPTAIYMLKHRTFPTPIIVIDNRDGRLGGLRPNDLIPDGYILIEGHSRFNMALYLAHISRLNPTVPVWFMSRA